MRILVLNGPNINLLGVREPGVYGSDSYADLLALVQRTGEEQGVETEVFQSNHEGALVDAIQQAMGRVDGLVLNPGAYTHTSIALLDALRAVQLPAVEVHISAVEQREAFRQVSYIRPACFLTITGEGIAGYARAIRELQAHILALRA
ncbi:type II 3-dehydroquinate dehydratase [Anaerofilum sp. BX8]|uniref:3-dehydroquinate dehydratase n=1 Tax=Anaerofilum hominis TaxID=2763016 RepID=A0A923I4Z0_9FIRM|nr:type II 3-dehydroquinate dehydratase [Anaerofilum hominis]MBC5580420.1 type II 3-dehydroquinate dehydratase [Anaerofilum hominis]